MKVNPSGESLETVAGTGSAGFSGDGGDAASARLDHPMGVAVDGWGNIFIADTRNYRIRRVTDTTVPTVSSVTSSTANGTYKAGVAISIQVNFSESVTVTGTPQLTLETGSTDAVVNYASGSGGAALTFTYTVGSGHTSADLDYASTSALALNGGTIKDAAGNAATLTLANRGGSNSLGNNKALVVDTTVPTVSSVTSSTADGAYKAELRYPFR